WFRAGVHDGPASSLIPEPSLVMNASSSSRFAFNIRTTLFHTLELAGLDVVLDPFDDLVIGGVGIDALELARARVLELEDREHVHEGRADRECQQCDYDDACKPP